MLGTNRSRRELHHAGVEQLFFFEVEMAEEMFSGVQVAEGKPVRLELVSFVDEPRDDVPVGKLVETSTFEADVFISRKAGRKAFKDHRAGNAQRRQDAIESAPKGERKGGIPGGRLMRTLPLR